MERFTTNERGARAAHPRHAVGERCRRGRVIAAAALTLVATSAGAAVRGPGRSVTWSVTRPLR